MDLRLQGLRRPPRRPSPRSALINGADLAADGGQNAPGAFGS